MRRRILPAVYNFVGTTWNATPSQLGALTLCRALVQALSSPVGGLLGKNLYVAWAEMAWAPENPSCPSGRPNSRSNRNLLVCIKQGTSTTESE